jgi:hypothetical protein
MKTSEMTGAALDWAVAKCEGQPDEWMADHKRGYINSPSTDWAQGGPIIERELIEIGAHEPEGFEWVARDYWKENTMTGPTPLIAAMRCFVASKLGDNIEIPEELTQGESK